MLPISRTGGGLPQPMWRTYCSLVSAYDVLATMFLCHRDHKKTTISLITHIFCLHRISLPSLSPYYCITVGTVPVITHLHLCDHYICYLHLIQRHFHPAFIVPLLLLPPPLIVFCHGLDPLLSPPQFSTNTIWLILQSAFSALIISLLFTLIFQHWSL